MNHKFWVFILRALSTVLKSNREIRVGVTDGRLSRMCATAWQLLGSQDSPNSHCNGFKSWSSAKTAMKRMSQKWELDRLCRTRGWGRAPNGSTNKAQDWDQSYRLRFFIEPKVNLVFEEYFYAQCVSGVANKCSNQIDLVMCVMAPYWR